MAVRQHVNHPARCLGLMSSEKEQMGRVDDNANGHREDREPEARHEDQNVRFPAIHTLAAHWIKCGRF